MMADDMHLDTLIACPTCDALYSMPQVASGETARCPRCHTTLAAPRALAMTRILMLAVAALVLLVTAMLFPFLKISAAGLESSSSIVDAVLAFSGGFTAPLTIAMAGAVVILPGVRLLALVYALGPMAIGHHPARHAIEAFGLSERLRPWAMAEIFIVGVAVALVKVAGLAHLSFGPAFWAFVGLVMVTVLQDSFMCQVTIWKTLHQRRLA